MVKVQLLCDLVECFLSSRSFIQRNTLSAWQIRSCRVAWLAAQSNKRLSCCVLYVTSYSILFGIYLSLSVLLREHKRYRSRVWNAKQHFAGTAPALETRVGGYTVFAGATFAVGAGKRRSFFELVRWRHSNFRSGWADQLTKNTIVFIVAPSWPQHDSKMRIKASTFLEGSKMQIKNKNVLEMACQTKRSSVNAWISLIAFVKFVYFRKKRSIHEG